MPYVSVPKDLSKVKSKIAFNLTKRQLICFGCAAVIGIPTYLFTRKPIGTDGAVFLMIGLMLPFFFLAMYEKDGQPAEKILRNFLRSRLWPSARVYKTENLYQYLNRQEGYYPLKSKNQKQQARLQSEIQQAKHARKSVSKQKGKPKNKAHGSGSLQKRVFGRSSAPQMAQQTIPYREMHRDGICRVNDRLYTKTIEFQDITYQLAQNEDKTQIFESYCDFLNYFDSTISVQLSFINRRVNIREFQQSIDIPQRDDDYKSIRQEYGDMLKDQLAKGNNGLVKTKYITFGIEADSLRLAKPRLERIEADILSNFKVLGVIARALDGKERLAILHGQFHPDGREKLRFDWKDIVNSGNGTKDYIAPASFDFHDSRMFRMSQHYGTVSFCKSLRRS